MEWKWSHCGAVVNGTSIFYENKMVVEHLENSQRSGCQLYSGVVRLARSLYCGMRLFRQSVNGFKLQLLFLLKQQMEVFWLFVGLAHVAV